MLKKANRIPIGKAKVNGIMDTMNDISISHTSTRCGAQSRVVTRPYNYYSKPNLRP